MVRKLKIMSGLVGFHGMLEQPSDLLREANQAYADGIRQRRLHSQNLIAER